MTFYSVSEPMENGTHCKVKFVHPECPLNKPKVGVVGYDFFCCEGGIGHVALNPVPCSVGFILLHVDGDSHLSLHPEILVVSPVVDILFREPTAGNVLL